VTSSFFEEKEKLQFDVHYRNDSRQKTTQKLYSNKLFDQIQEYTQDVINYISPSDFDVVYAHDWMTFLAAMELQVKGLKFVAHVHSLTFDRVGEKDKGWIYQIERRALQKAARIIPVSHYTGRICCKYYQADFYKLAVVHNAISFSKIDFDQERNLKHIAFIGRLTYQKAPSHFIEIAKELINRDPEYRFTMIGEGDEYSLLKKEVKQFNLDQNIRLVGFIEHQKIEKVLNNSAIYCMPSISEPFGLSALEAVQYGLVPIISEQSGAAEVLNNAVKVNYWDKNGFVDSILKISKNRGIFDRIHEKCVEDLELSSWDLTTEKILTILEETQSKILL
jgi:glycosyltransferase involved in cell wall biosynthesis